MNLIIRNKKLVEAITIIIGTFLMAFATNSFFAPSSLVTGGVTGLGIIIDAVSVSKFSFAIPLWITNVIFNVPLFAIGVKVNGRAFLSKTFFATVSLTVALYLTQGIVINEINESNIIISALFGGVFSGIGLGLVFRCNATTGGADLAASIVHRYVRHISLSRILFVIDSVVIVLGVFVFGPVKAMYAIVAVFTASQVISAILEGLNFAKASLIISERTQEIAQEVINRLSRGATSLSGRGMYTGNAKDVLLCVVSQKEVVILKEIVAEIDKNAFIIVADVREVLGEGFAQF